MFYNKLTGKFHRPGEHVFPPQDLCNTYKRIALEGGEDFYTGKLAKDIIMDLKEIGSVITEEDLQKYKCVCV